MTGALRRPTDGAVAGFVSVLFTGPNLVLAAGLRPMPGAILGLAGLLAAGLLLRGFRHPSLGRPAAPRALAGALALAVLVLVLGGALHVVYANPDWLIRDAVLADLARDGFPLGYRIEGIDYLLRAPLGMYLMPGLAGRAGGLLAAHGALLVQNALLLGGLFYLVMRIGRGPAQLALLVLSGGLGLLWRPVQAAALGDPSFVLYWARPLDEWNALFQYSSSMTQFFWVPNHALPGWWLGLLLILCARRVVDVATVGITVATLCLWSPLAILPAVPALLWFAATRGRAVFGAVRTWLGAAVAAGFAPVALYVSAAAGTIEHGSPAARDDFAGRYFIFILLQLAPAILCILHRERIEPALRGLFGLSVAILVALPFLSFGPNNDLVMRGSIPALVVVAFVFASVLRALVRDRSPAAILAVAIAVIGAAPALVETARALLAPRFAVSACDLVEASRDLGDLGAPANYMARLDRMPGWLVATPGAVRVAEGGVRCWPDLRRPDVEPPGGPAP